jgi:hemoglobin/transferrin/lactoferrin receptor protein
MACMPIPSSPTLLRTALLMAGFGTMPELFADTAPVALQPISITATRQAQPVDQVPSTVSVVDREQLERGNVSNLKDLVRYEPGVSVSGAGQRSGLAGYTIRGIDGDRILTQVDGVEIPGGFFNGPYAQTSRNYVDPEIVKRVEILRGPASVLYGSNAIGGAVSYFTLDPDDIIKPGANTGARLKSGYHSADHSWLTSASVAGRRGPFDALLHASQRSGRETASHGEHGGTGLSRSAADPKRASTTNLLAKAGWDYDAHGRLMLTYEQYRDDRDSQLKSAVGGPFAAGAGIGMYKSRSANDSIGRQRFGLAHDLSLDTPLADTLEWRLNYQRAKTEQRTEEVYFPFSREVLRVRDAAYEERQWVLDAQLNKAFGVADSEHLLTYGVTLKRQQVTGQRSGHGICLRVFGECRAVGADSVRDRLQRASDFPDPTTYTASLFAQDQIAWGPWTLQPGARYDYTHMAPRLTDAFLRTVDPSEDAAVSERGKAWHRFTPRLGLTYAFDAHYSGYAQYSQGFRTPTAKMLYGRFENREPAYVVAPNPNLKPERSQSLEAGLRGHFEAGHFDLALYYNQYRDFIHEDAVGAGADQMVFQTNNIRRASIHGAELKGRLALDAFGAPQGLYGQGSLAYMNGRNQDSGQPLNSLSPLTGVLGLGYERRQYGGLLSWTLVQRKQHVDDSRFFAPDGTSQQFKTPGYGILDLTGFYKVDDDITLNAGLYNLADQKYWQWDDVRGYDSVGEAAVLAPANLDRLTQPGRHFSVNLVWDI